MARLGTLMLLAACSAGCWNSRDGLRADWGKGGGSLFDRGNAQARSKDRAMSDSLDPADDVFLGRNRSQLADAGSKGKDDPPRERPRRTPRATDDDDSVLMEASSKESPRPRGRMIDGEEPATPASKGGGSAVEQTAEYTKIRGRLEAIKASWSSEKLSGGRGFMVRCEVPHPTDAELAQVFEARSADELSALRAAVVQAEKWRAGVRRRFDPAEADLDPFTP